MGKALEHRLPVRYHLPPTVVFTRGLENISHNRTWFRTS